MEELAKLKPRLRGVSHQWAFVVFLGLGALLVALASGAAERAAAAIFAGPLVAIVPIGPLLVLGDRRSRRPAPGAR